jgi:hypothetical protein
MILFALFVFGVFVRDEAGITEGRGVFGAFVRGVGFELSAIGCAVLFDFFRFLLGEFGFGGSLVFGGVLVRRFLSLFFLGFFLLREFGFTGGVNFLGFVFFELGATSERIARGVVGSFLMLCFGKLGREGDFLLFT